jgi:hypothetical protein
VIAGGDQEIGLCRREAMHHRIAPAPLVQCLNEQVFESSAAEHKRGWMDAR